MESERRGGAVLTDRDKCGGRKSTGITVLTHQVRTPEDTQRYLQPSVKTCTCFNNYSSHDAQKLEFIAVNSLEQSPKWNGTPTRRQEVSEKDRGG